MSEQPSTVVLDATNHIAGRLCSYVAKMLLKGETVVIVNAEKAVMSGSKRGVMREQHEFLEISSVVHPKHGPFHPRRPDRILTRMVRGMVPRTKPKGVSAMKRLRVYIGVPKDYEDMKTAELEKAKIRKPVSYYIRIGDLAREIGWQG
ncbi:MAG: 50S ribosomal protein L13 [Nitrososphaerales archaeon]